MKTGLVVAEFPQRHYSFLKDDVTGEEIFFHHSDAVGAIPGKLTRVQFETVEYQGRIKATKVQVLS